MNSESDLASVGQTGGRFPIERVRSEFPLIATGEVCYLDSAASAQKPQAVLDALDSFYRERYANIHRGLYPLSVQASEEYRLARERVARFINAQSTEQIVFTSGTTGSINLVAHSWGLSSLRPGDEIICSLLEHHSNIVPWQIVAEQTGAVLRFISLTADGELDMDDFRCQLSGRTKIVAVTQLANALGVQPQLTEIISEAHQAGAKVLVDGAQSISHSLVDVSELGADFFVFSGHKLYGPTGIGVLYASAELLEQMPPYQGGGDMIRSVTVEGTEYAPPPQRFEAGTQNIAGVIGLVAAMDYLDSYDRKLVFAHEQQIIARLESALRSIPGLKVLGPEGQLHGLVTFTVDKVHPHDVAQFLAAKNIAVRAGHHCAQPLMKALGCSATTRASVGMYTSEQDVEALAAAIPELIAFFK